MFRNILAMDLSEFVKIVDDYCNVLYYRKCGNNNKKN